MAFDISAENLRDEVRHAEEVRDDFLGYQYEDKIARYAGPGYRSHWKQGSVDFENHSYQWISLFLPLLASGNPRIKARSPRPGFAQQIAKAVEMAVNRNFQLQNIKAVIEKLAIDFAFKHCIAITLPAKRPGMSEAEDPPHRPVTKRISPTRYICDPQALEYTDARFQAHLIRRDKDDLLAEADAHPSRGWNKELISALTEDRPAESEKSKWQSKVSRGEIEYYEIYVPEHRLKVGVDAKGKEFKPKEGAGYHGTIVTVPASYSSVDTGKNKPEWLREPRPFFGPRGGPYTFGGYLIVPDEVMPLSPLAATQAQSEELNNMRQAMSAAIESFKIGVAVDSMAGVDMAQKMKEFEDLGVFVLDGVDRLTDHLAKIQLGGATPEHFQQLDFLRDSLDRSSGMTEAQRGQVGGGSTATEASIAQSGAGQRAGYMTEKFITTVAKPIAEKEAWYLARDPRSRIMLGQDSAGMFRDEKTGEVIFEPVELVGSSKNLSELEESEINIEAISMRYTSEALEAERSMMVDQLIMGVIPSIPQMPYVDWETYLTWKGEQIANPDLARIVNLDKAMQLGQLMMGAQLQGPAHGGVQPQPRMGIDLPKPNLKASESPQGFSKNARPQPQKGPRSAGESSNTHGPAAQAIK